MDDGRDEIMQAMNSQSSRSFLFLFHNKKMSALIGYDLKVKKKRLSSPDTHLGQGIFGDQECFVYKSH